MRVSAVVMTLNEEHNIEFCLRSLRSWCDEIVVVDMFSDDRTAELAASLADKVLTHERTGFVEPARAHGFAAASGDWIVNIDADEVIPPRLAQWIREFVDGDPPIDYVLVPRINVFLGRWIKSTHWWPGKPRLFRPEKMSTGEQIHHGFQPLPGARRGTIPRDPQLSIWHFTHPTLHGLVEKTNHYTTIEARQALAGGAGRPRLRELVGAPLREVGTYVVRGGFRDGLAGLAYSVDRVYYAFLSVIKRWDETEAGQRQARYDEQREEILRGYPDGGRARPAAARTEPSGSATRPDAPAEAQQAPAASAPSETPAS